MSKQICELSPKRLWKHFKEISQIPRPSKKEARISAFIKKFGEDLGLVSKMDTVGNVIIKKPATVGYENLKSVVLQAHIDMVPQKTPESTHNFETDPIRPLISGDWVTADQTTLGADNGIGTAAILTVLESDSIVHGPIEALFTVDEETGLTGAAALKPGQLESDILVIEATPIKFLFGCYTTS